MLSAHLQRIARGSDRKAGGILGVDERVAVNRGHARKQPGDRRERAGPEISGEDFAQA